MFDRTTSGVHQSAGGVVTSPVAMWIEAVDLLLTRIHESEGGKELLARVAAISGAAQVRRAFLLYLLD